MHELISPDSAIDPLVTSQLGVCCKRTGVSHLVVKLHSMYKCRLVLRTPYACNPVIDGSVLIVTGESASLSTVQSLFLIRYRGWALHQYFVVAHELSSRIYRVVCADSGGFPSCLRRALEEQLRYVWSGESPSWV